MHLLLSCEWTQADRRRSSTEGVGGCEGLDTVLGDNCNGLLSTCPRVWATPLAVLRPVSSKFSRTKLQHRHRA